MFFRVISVFVLSFMLWACSLRAVLTCSRTTRPAVVAAAQLAELITFASCMLSLGALAGLCAYEGWFT